jgi:hypothetical protein
MERETTSDPLDVFRKYEEGVVINEETREVTLSPAVQKDLVQGCAFMIHETRKYQMCLGIVFAAIEQNTEESLAHAQGLISALLTDPQGVQMFETDDPAEAQEIIRNLELQAFDEEDEVQN